MQKSNLICLKTTKWPFILSWVLYFLGLSVILVMPLQLTLKLLMLAVMSGYLLWWFWREQGFRVTQVTLLNKEHAWLLTLASGEEKQVTLTGYAKLGGWAVLHFKHEKDKNFNVLIASNTVSKNTFRRLLVYLNADLTR